MQEIKAISTYKQNLKSKILEAAMEAFRERGIRAVKMDDIAQSLTISKRTLYELYDNKEVLLFEGVKKFRESMSGKMEQIVRESDNVMEVILKVYRVRIDEFRNTNPRFYADLVKYPTVLRYLNRENQRVRGDVNKFLERGVLEGYFREEVNYELTSRLFDALGRYIMAQQLYNQYGMEEIFNSLVFVYLRGVCTEKGVKELDNFYFYKI